MGFNSNLHNIESYNIIKDINKYIKKVFLLGVVPEF